MGGLERGILRPSNQALPPRLLHRRPRPASLQVLERALQGGPRPGSADAPPLPRPYLALVACKAEGGWRTSQPLARQLMGRWAGSWSGGS
jgi:hypothetical protein